MKNHKPRRGSRNTIAGNYSRNNMRQTLKASHMGRQIATEPQEPKPEPLTLPERITLPEAILGAGFNFEFRRFDYVGKRKKKIGQVRTRELTLWRTSWNGLKAGLCIELPLADSVTAKDIRAAIERATESAMRAINSTPEEIRRQGPICAPIYGQRFKA